MNTSNLDIRIARISDLPGKNAVNRWEMMHYGTQSADVAVDLHVRLEQDMLMRQLTLTVSAHYSYMRSMVKRPLLTHAVEAVFEIPGLEECVAFDRASDLVALPVPVMQLMLNVAIGALRGMIARRTSGTPLEDRPLPLVDVSALVVRLIDSRSAKVGELA